MHRRLPSWLGIAVGRERAGAAVTASQQPDAPVAGTSLAGERLAFQQARDGRARHGIVWAGGIEGPPGGVQPKGSGIL
jgi:hypothetical protein